MTGTHTGDQIGLRPHFWLLFGCWSLIMLVALGADLLATMRTTRDMVRLQARTAVEKDLVYREWNARHGGVYARIDADTRPNPYLDAPEREITTASGTRLTLVNPAYMTRQVLRLQGERHGVIGHIASLEPLNPVNRPDPWEEKALRRFASGEQEVTGMVTIAGKRYYRYMRPLWSGPVCLKCHEAPAGGGRSLRGGLSVAIPMDQWQGVERAHLRNSSLLFLAFWLSGCLGLWWTSRRLGREVAEGERLRAELAGFKVTLDELNDAVCIYDPGDWSLVYCNQAALRLTGHDPEALAGLAVADLYPELDAQAFAGMKEMLLSGEKESFVFETMLRRAAGGCVPVELKIDHVRGHFSGQGRLVMVVRDVEKRKLAEREKRQMEVRLLQAQKLEAIGQLAAGIAHEINTPVQYVATNLEFLQEAFADLGELLAGYGRLLEQAREGRVDPALAEQVAELQEEVDWPYLAGEIPKALEQSSEGVQRVSRIVRAMKEFSHPASREKAPLDLNHLLETTLTVSKNEWKYVAEVETDFDPDLPDVPGIADHLGQVFLNLVINAAQAIESRLDAEGRDGKGTIRIRTRRVQDMAEVRIEDDGPGIPESLRSKIFEPFFTTKEVGKGTGQGLAIARDIVVNKHGGRLLVESEEGAGATFVVRLPLAGQEDGPAGDPKGDGGPAGPGGGL